MQISLWISIRSTLEIPEGKVELEQDLQTLLPEVNYITNCDTLI